MNKVKVMTATVTIVAGLGAASHVNADEVDFSTATQNSEAQANQVESNVTKADVDAAKANLDTANQAVSVQEQVVNDAATVADEAQSAYDQAQQSTSDAQNLVDQATPEAISEATADVTAAQEQVSQADNAERVAENTVAQVQEAVNNQTEVVNSAQTAVDAAQTAVDAAQKDVNDKQAILDGTGQAEIIANRDKAQDDVNLAQNQVAQAESDLTKAQTAKAQQTEQALADAQSVYKTAENDYKAINTITLSEDYIRLLKQSYTANTLQERQQALEELKLKNNDLKPEYVFKSNSNDDKHIVDLNNLSLNQLTELSLFASDLVNQIRQQVGSASTVVTDSSVGFAKKVTENYILDNWDMAKGHDAFAVNNAAKYYGLSTSTEQWEKQGLQYYENWAGLSRNSQSTMSDLKADIYDAIYRFMFDGDEYDHASSIAGIRAANTTTVSYLGVGFTSLSTSRFDGVHFLLVGDNYVKNAQNNNFSTTVIENLKTPEKVTTTYNTAKADLEAKTATNNSVQSALSAAQNNYNNAVAINTKAQQVLDEAQSVAVQTPTAQANLTLAETALTKAQERLTKATQAVDALNADIKAKQAALTSAKATLEAAKSALANSQAENSVAQEAKAAAQTAYDNAVSNLLSASATLTQTQSVAIQMPTAQANLASAQSTLKQAQENLVKAQQAVDNLSADIKVKQANLASAKQVLASKQADLTAKQDVLTQAKARLASLQADLLMAQENVVTAKANVDKAKAMLDEAQATLANLKNAPQLLKEAQAKEAIAKANLLDALDTLEAELLKLKDLQVKQAATQAVYDTTSKAYQTMLDAQEKQRLQDEYDAIIAQGKTPVAIVDKTGKIIGYHIAIPQTVVAHPTTAQVVSKASKAVETPTAFKATVTPQSSALPTTGDSKSVLAILSGGLLTLFGLIGVRKRKEN